MALTRKFLSALGIEADKVDEIITAHAETVNALKEQRDTYKADADKLKDVQKELDGLKEANGDGKENPFEVKYNALKEEFDAYKEKQEAEAAATAKREAYRALLKEAGVSEKRIDTVLKVTSMDGVELDKDGKIKDAQKVTEGIKSEWSDFIVTKRQRGANVANPPAKNGANTVTKESIMAIKDGTERRKAIAANPDLFGLKLGTNNE